MNIHNLVHIIKRCTEEIETNLIGRYFIKNTADSEDQYLNIKRFEIYYIANIESEYVHCKFTRICLNHNAHVSVGTENQKIRTTSILELIREEKLEEVSVDDMKTYIGSVSSQLEHFMNMQPLKDIDND